MKYLYVLWFIFWWGIDVRAQASEWAQVGGRTAGVESASVVSEGMESPCTAIHTDTTIRLACGDSLMFRGALYRFSTTQTDTFSSVTGCDSIVTLHLYVTNTIYVNDSICPGDTLLFYGNSLDNPGIYTTFRNGNNQCDSFIILNLAVVHLPPVYVSASPHCDTLTVYYLTGVQWYYNNNPIHGATQSTYIEHQDGTYTVSGIDSEGCMVFSNPGSLWPCLGAISYIKYNLNISILPNPSTSTFYFTGIPIGAQIQIYDVLGEEVSSSIATGSVNEVSLGSEAKGIYFYRVIDATGVIGNGKMVLE